MPNQVVYTFIASDKFSRIAKKMADQTANFSSNMKDLRTEAAATSGAINRLAGGIRRIGFRITAAGAAFSALQVPFLRQFAQLEKLQVGFEQIVGSAEKGQKVFKDLQRFQRGTPFNLIAIKNAAQTLLVFGTETKDLRLELTALGNIAAASGGSIEDLAFVFGKAQTAGRVTQDVINSLALRGVNVMEIWAEKTGASVEQIRKAISKGQVPFEALRKTILDLAGREGGRLFGIMEKQSKRLAGAWVRFTGSVTLASGALGGVLSEAGDVPGFLNFLERAVRRVTTAVVNWTERHPFLTKLIARFGTVLLILGSLMVAFSVILQVVAFTLLPILILKFLGWRAVMSAIMFLMPGLSLVVRGVTLAFGTLIGASATVLAALVLIPLALFLIIKNFGKIKLFFQFLIEDIVELAGVIIRFLLKPVLFFFNKISSAFGIIFAGISKMKEKAGGALGKLGGSLSRLFEGEEIKVQAGGELTSKSTTDVNVNLNAPKGVIASIKSKTTGAVAGLNVGVNMAEAL